MIQIYDDFWRYASDNKIKVLCCTTNSVLKTGKRLIMGAGIAKQFRDRFKDLDLEWGSRITKQISSIGCNSPVFYSKRGKLCLVYFQTKINWREPSDLELIKRSAYSLGHLAKALNWDSILMTRPGCGNGGLQWNDVEPVIEKSLSRFIDTDIVKVVHAIRPS